MLTTIGRGRHDPPRDLVDLLMDCHGRIRSFVQLAVAAGTRSDATPDQVTEACRGVERYFTEALPLHVADEEESILPRLRGRSADLDRALDDMRQQHADHEPQLEALLRTAAALREQPGDAAKRAELVEVARELESAFEEHLQLEEKTIFVAIREELPADVQDELLQELRRRRGVPAG